MAEKQQMVAEKLVALLDETSACLKAVLKNRDDDDARIKANESYARLEHTIVVASFLRKGKPR